MGSRDIPHQHHVAQQRDGLQCLPEALQGREVALVDTPTHTGSVPLHHLICEDAVDAVLIK